MESNTLISVIVPAYNEAKRISTNIERIHRYFATKNYDYEVIVVNDGSTDDTQKVVDQFCVTFPNMRSIGYENNQGKGNAVRFGMQHARGDYHLFTDADGSVHIDHLDQFLPYLNEGYDVVIGSIELEGRHIQENAAWYRRILGTLSKRLIRIMAVPGIMDSQRGFKLFSRRASHDIFSRLTIQRWGFDIEALVIARSYGYAIKELPVNWINASGSLVDADRFAFLRTLKELFEINGKSIIGFYRPQGFRFGFETLGRVIYKRNY